MTFKIDQLRFVNEFKCLGSDCEDTCCQGWGMQVNKSCIKKYEEECPELLNDVVSGEAEHIMRRDPKTDLCVHYKSGLCSIHKDKGDSFLGDACNFYPRITRKYGSNIVMSAALSCPETARKIFQDENPFEFVENNINRIPEEIIDYLPEDISSDHALKTIRDILDFSKDTTKTPDRIMSCLISVFISLDNLDVKTWPDAIPFYLKMSENRLLPIEEGEHDTMNLVLFFAVLVHSSKKKDDRKLNKILDDLQSSLGIEIDKETLELKYISGDSCKTKEIYAKWKDCKNDKIEGILRRYISAQIMIAGYPFSGLGSNMQEKAIIFSVKYALFKLTIMSYLFSNNEFPDDKEIVNITYRLSRFIDHIADPTLSLSMYNEAGWNKEGRLRAVIGDV